MCAPSRGVIASCVDRSTVHLWDLVTGEPVSEPVRATGAFVTALAAAWRADGTPGVVVGDRDGNVRLI